MRVSKGMSADGGPGAQAVCPVYGGRHGSNHAARLMSM